MRVRVRVGVRVRALSMGHTILRAPATETSASQQRCAVARTVQGMAPPCEQQTCLGPCLAWVRARRGILRCCGGSAMSEA